MNSLSLATKGMICQSRSFNVGNGGHIRTEEELPKPLIKVYKVEYSNGIKDKDETIVITKVKLE